MGKILVSYTKTEGHPCAYNQKTGDEIWSINDLIDDANDQIIKLERQNKLMREALEKLSRFGEGTHGSRKCSSFDCLADLQIEMEERMELSQETLEKVDGKA